MGGEFGGEWIHVYVRLSPFSVHLKPSQTPLFITYPAIQNKNLKKQFWRAFLWLIIEKWGFQCYLFSGSPIVWEKEKGEYDLSFEKSRIPQLAEDQPHTSRDFPVLGWLEFNLLMRLPGFPELSGKVIIIHGQTSSGSHDTWKSWALALWIASL